MTEEIKPVTPCECHFAKIGEGGFCARHHIKKSAHFGKLCATRQDYFNMYEACAGPGQEFTNCDGTDTPPVIDVQMPDVDCPSCKDTKDSKAKMPEPKKRPDVVNPATQKLPSLWQQAKNFAKASVDHVKGGMHEVSPEVKQARLDTCYGCEFYIKDSGRCAACGCFLQTKARWLANSCPKGKWIE